MEIKDYWLLLRKFRILIMSCVLASTVSSIYYTQSQTPLYTAYAQLYVSIPNTVFDPASNQIAQLAAGGSFTEARVFSYAQIINSPSVLNRVIQELNLNIDAQTLGAAISADAPPNSVLINLYVTTENPEISSKIANSVAENFDILVQTLEVVSSASTMSDGGAVRIELIKPAEIPSYPSYPRKNLNLAIGLLMGFLIGISVALARKFFENKVKNESHLSGVPLIANIRFDKSVKTEPLITDSNSFSNRNESFRILRANLLNRVKNDDKDNKVIALMSSVAKEGKTSTILNLGVSLSQAGLRILIIETDLRKPTFARYISDSQPNGSKNLIDFLNYSPTDIDSKLLKTVPLVSLNENLKLIQAGDSIENPTELLSNDNLGKLIQYYKQDHDFILLDTAPVLLVADAIVVSKYIDSAVLVVSAGKTRVDVYSATVNHLRESNVRVIGVILNKVPKDRLGEYGYSVGSEKIDSYYGYGYYVPTARYYNQPKRVSPKSILVNFFSSKEIRRKIESSKIFESPVNSNQEETASIHHDNVSKPDSVSGISRSLPWLSQRDESDFNIEDFLDTLTVKKAPVKKAPVKKAR